MLMFRYIHRLIHIILQVIHTISQTFCVGDTALVNCGLNDSEQQPYLIIKETVITFVSLISN